MLHAGRQDVAILRRVWSTELDEHLRHADRGRVRRRQRAGRLRQPARRDPRRARRQDRQLHALGRAAADRRAAQLRRRGRRAPARAHRRAPAPPARDRRLEWAHEECRRLESATDERDPDTAWERLPRVNQLDPRARAVARELAAWRERTASTEDRPVGSVLADPPLVELAKRQPSGLRGLEQIRGIHPSGIRRRGQAILEAIGRGREAAPIPRDEPRGRSDPGDAPLIALAEALLRARALEAGLAYELIASRSELEQIVAASRRGDPEPDVRTLTGWRRELVGDDLRDLLAGRSAVSVGPGRRLELTPRDGQQPGEPGPTQPGPA